MTLGQVGISDEEPLYVLGLDLQSLMHRYVKAKRYDELWLGHKVEDKIPSHLESDENS